MSIRKKYLSVSELAKLLGVSRTAVHKWIKNGTIKADRIGASYAINMKNIAHIISGQPTARDKKVIEKTVDKTLQHFKETLELLAKDDKDVKDTDGKRG